MSLPLRADASPKAAEPSMEEILASIRKIIADDEPAKPATAPAPAKVEAPVVEEAPKGQDDIDALLAGLDDMSAAMEEQKPDVLELTEAMAAPEPVLSTADIDFIEPTPAPFVPPKPPVEPPAPKRQEMVFPTPKPMPQESLISAQTDSAISAAFGTLTHTILSQNARTIDDLVQDMLRPMLKNWLDENLPTMVERLVRAEIERVSRGGR